MKRSFKTCSLCGKPAKTKIGEILVCESCKILENRVDKIVAAFLATPQPHPKLDPMWDQSTKSKSTKKSNYTKKSKSTKKPKKRP